MKRLLLLLLLAGCTTTGDANQAVVRQTSTVRSMNGGQAELTLIACTTTASMKDVEDALHRLLAELVTAGLLVRADTGSAKLVVNLCG